MGFYLHSIIFASIVNSFKYSIKVYCTTLISESSRAVLQSHIVSIHGFSIYTSCRLCAAQLVLLLWTHFTPLCAHHGACVIYWSIVRWSGVGPCRSLAPFFDQPVSSAIKRHEIWPIPDRDIASYSPALPPLFCLLTWPRDTRLEACLSNIYVVFFWFVSLRLYRSFAVGLLQFWQLIFIGHN